MDRPKINKIRNSIEGFTHVPDDLYETELSFEAQGLFIVWLQKYQHGQTVPLFDLIPRGEWASESARSMVRELMESGLMPTQYAGPCRTWDTGVLELINTNKEADR